MSDITLAKVIQDRYYNSIDTTNTHFGREDRRVAQHYRVYKEISKTFPELPYIVPSSYYKPEIMVAFDFTHRFTTAGGATGIDGKKPVSEETLKRVSASVFNYFDSYFGYVSTPYNKAGKFSFFLEGDAGSSNHLVMLNRVINYYLSSVSVSQAVNQIGTCSITLNENNNYPDGINRVGLFFDRLYGILAQLFVPMIPVMIWARGRLYRDWYFPIFDGYITSPGIDDSSGYRRVVINCKDTLELANFSTEMVNPSLIQVKEIVKQENLNIFSQPFFGLDHLDIFSGMFFGGRIHYDPELRRKRFITSKDPAFQKAEGASFSALGNFVKSKELDTSSIDPITVSETTGAVHKDDMSMSKLISEVSHSTRPRIVTTWGGSMTPYRLTTKNTIQTFTAEFSSRLEVLANLAESVYFNYYVDGYGTVHYHPMRMANTFLMHDIVEGRGNSVERHVAPFPGTQVIGPHETTNSNFNVSSEELVTYLRLTGQPSADLNIENEALVGLTGSAVNENLLARFGYRRKSVSNTLLNFPIEIPQNRKGSQAKDNKTYLIDLMADALLHYMNAELSTAQASMPFRPEFKIARPILFPDENNVFYGQSVEHTIDINGDASTSVGANFGRKELEPPPDLYSYLVMTELHYKLNNISIQENPGAAIQTISEFLQFYSGTFNVNDIPFIDWVGEYQSAAAKYNKLEDSKSKETADRIT